MDFDDSDLVFDFEADLEDAASDSSVVVGAASASNALDPAAAGQHHDQGTVRRTVCKYWLKGLCMRGQSCGYLHQYDLERMPVCHFFRADGCCSKLDCIFKHNAEDAKECAIFAHCVNQICASQTLVHEMEFDDSNLVFDFEADLEDAGSDYVIVGASAPNELDPAAVGLHHDQGPVRRTMCKYWLKGLCMKGESCGYLHQYDLDCMPVCHFFRANGCCSKQDCIFKHNAEDAKECTMYNMGFCPNGPCCPHRHVKKPGPPPPAEEVVKKLQQMNSWNYGSSSATYQARNNNSNQQEKSRVEHGSVRESQNLAANATPVVKQPAAHHAQTANPQHVPPPHTQQQQQHAQVQGVPNGSSDQVTITASPLLQGQSRYSVVKSCNQENLEISVQQGVWAFQKGVMMSF